MRQMPPLQIILIGFALVLLGWILPFLMVLHVIEADFFLSFLSYAASVGGLLLGIIGATFYIRRGKR